MRKAVGAAPSATNDPTTKAYVDNGFGVPATALPVVPSTATRPSAATNVVWVGGTPGSPVSGDYRIIPA